MTLQTAKCNPLIMIVDDYPANVMIGSLLLDDLGYDFVVANNGFEALDLYESNNVSLILMDLQMPQMSGFETALRIRNYEINQKRKKVPIIAVSANTKMNGGQCLESGMDDFLPKPYLPEDLGNIIHLHLSGNMRLRVG